MSTFSQPLTPANPPFVTLNPSGMDPGQSAQNLSQLQMGREQNNLRATEIQSQMQLGREQNQLQYTQSLMRQRMAEREQELQKRQLDLEQRRMQNEFTHRTWTEKNSRLLTEHQMQMDRLRAELASAQMSGDEEQAAQLQGALDGLRAKTMEVGANVTGVGAVHSIMSGAGEAAVKALGDVLQLENGRSKVFKQARESLGDVLLAVSRDRKTPEEIAAGVVGGAADKAAKWEMNPLLRSIEKSKMVKGITTALLPDSLFEGAAAEYQRKTDAFEGPGGDDLVAWLASNLQPGKGGVNELKGNLRTLLRQARDLTDPGKSEEAAASLKRTYRKIEEAGNDPKVLDGLLSMLYRETSQSKIEAMLKSADAGAQGQMIQDSQGKWVPIQKPGAEAAEMLLQINRALGRLQGVQGDEDPVTKKTAVLLRHWGDDQAPDETPRQVLGKLMAAAGSGTPDEFIKLMQSEDPEAAFGLGEVSSHTQDFVEELKKLPKASRDQVVSWMNMYYSTKLAPAVKSLTGEAFDGGRLKPLDEMLKQKRDLDLELIAKEREKGVEMARGKGARMKEAIGRQQALNEETRGRMRDLDEMLGGTDSALGPREPKDGRGLDPRAVKALKRVRNIGGNKSR